MGNYDERMPNNEETSLTMIHKLQFSYKFEINPKSDSIFLVKKTNKT